MSKKTVLVIVSAMSLLSTACGGMATDESRAPGVYVDNGKATFVSPDQNMEPDRVQAMVTCVPVYCDGELAGSACGDTVGKIIERAVGLCGG
jgi:hypothetical protein